MSARWVSLKALTQQEGPPLARRTGPRVPAAEPQGPDAPFPATERERVKNQGHPTPHPQQEEEPRPHPQQKSLSLRPPPPWQRRKIQGPSTGVGVGPRLAEPTGRLGAQCAPEAARPAPDLLVSKPDDLGLGVAFRSACEEHGVPRGDVCVLGL